jgi:hypothetical protein
MRCTVKLKASENVFCVKSMSIWMMGKIYDLRVNFLPKQLGHFTDFIPS